MFRWILMVKKLFTPHVQEFSRRSKARRPRTTVRLNLEALEDRTLPSASSLPAVFEASPSVAAISSYVSSMMEQRAQLIATIEQMVIGDYQVLSQEIVQAVSYVQEQWDHLLGINPNPPNPSLSTAVPQPGSGSGSGSGMGRGNSSGSGSGSSAMTTDNAPNQSLNIGTQQSGSGSGSGSSTPTTHGNGPTQGGNKVQPRTSSTGSGSATVCGQVWLDNNGNGILEDNPDYKELGFSGITVMLGDVSTGQVYFTTTDANGDYQFIIPAKPAPGDNYQLQVQIPTNDEATIQGADSDIDAGGSSPVFALAAGGAVNILAGIRSMNVTTTQDDANGPIQNQITLRDAIETGNNGPPAAAVTFQAGLSGTITLQAALDPIKTSYNIQGPGSGALTVNGNNNAGTIFTVNAGVTSTISGLTIRGGFVSGKNGGGIYNAGTLTLKSDIVRNNTALADANGAGGAGGGIFNLSDGNLTLYYTQVDDNTAASAGGGVANSGTFSTSAGVESSIFLNNAEVGGGIANVGNLATAKILDPTTIFSNKASKEGGGVFNSLGTATISGSGGTNKQINLNEAPSGGGIYVVSGELTLKSLNVMTNEATAGDGGGLFLAGASTTNFKFVTVSGNTATGQGAGVAYEKNATMNGLPAGLTDKDDPGGNPVLV